MKQYSAALALSLLLLGSTMAQAGGFAQPNQSAAGAGVANAFVATANDASAMIYNPAGIAWQDGVSVTGGLTINFRDSSVELPAGVAPNSNTEPTVGTVYAAWMPHDGRLGFGLGFSPLYQINNNWESAFGTKTGQTKLTVDHLAADAIYAINSDLAIAVGGDWYVSRLDMSQGTQVFNGTDFAGFGGHVSLLWKPLPAWSLGVMFRSRASMDIAGNVNDSVSLRVPDTLVAGVAHDFFDVLRLEADVNWTRWSTVNDLNVVAGGTVTQSNPLNLRDTVTLMGGVTWTWQENSQIRLGYAYDQGANKSAGFHPAIADQDGHRVSIGVGGDGFGMHVDVAYSYVFYPKQTATGIFAGTYRDREQAVLISVSKIF
ncbi:MAG: OmpP1/FadL family transporter [Mariprofundaceae bacterium]